MANHSHTGDPEHRPTERDRQITRSQRSRAEVRARSTADLMPKLMKSLGIQNRMWEEALLEEWPAIVGPQVCKHARPGRLEHGTLYIYVTHSVWLSELQRNQQQLLENLQARFEKATFKRIRLQLDPDLER